MLCGIDIAQHERNGPGLGACFRAKDIRGKQLVIRKQDLAQEERRRLLEQRLPKHRAPASRQALPPLGGDGFGAPSRRLVAHGGQHGGEYVGEQPGVQQSGGRGGEPGGGGRDGLWARGGKRATQALEELLTRLRQVMSTSSALAESGLPLCPPLPRRDGVSSLFYVCVC